MLPPSVAVSASSSRFVPIRPAPRTAERRRTAKHQKKHANAPEQADGPYLEPDPASLRDIPRQAPAATYWISYRYRLDPLICQATAQQSMPIKHRKSRKLIFKICVMHIRSFLRIHPRLKLAFSIKELSHWPPAAAEQSEAVTSRPGPLWRTGSCNKLIHLSFPRKLRAPLIEDPFP